MQHRDDLGAWCEALPLLRRLAAAQGRAAEVAELVGNARTDASTVTRLDELGRQLGIPSVGPRSTVGVPGVSPGAPTDGLFVCPTARCGRDWVRAPGVATPECHLFGETLTQATPQRHPR